MLFEEGTVCKICGKRLAGRGLIGYEYCSIHYGQYALHLKSENKVETKSDKTSTVDSNTSMYALEDEEDDLW